MHKNKNDFLKEFKIIYRNSVAEAKHTVNHERSKINRFIKDKFIDAKQELEDLAVYFDEKFNHTEHHKHRLKKSHNHKSKK